jgi:hypothetical protein
VDQATEDVDTLNSASHGRCHGPGSGGSGNVEINTTVRPAAVVVLEIPAKNPLKVPRIPDQRPVQALGSDGAYPPLGVGVRLRRPWRDLDHLHAGRSEHRVEGCRELGVPVTDQESEPVDSVVEVHQQVPGCLRHPGTGRMCGNPDQGHPTPVKLDDKQDIQPGQPDRLHREKVAHQRSGSLRPQEHCPTWAAAPRCRAKPTATQDPPHRRRRHPHTELAALPHDPYVSPARILPRHPHHQLDDIVIQSAPAPSRGRIRPATSHQFAMPAQQRARRDRQRRPTAPSGAASPTWPTPAGPAARIAVGRPACVPPSTGAATPRSQHPWRPALAPDQPSQQTRRAITNANMPTTMTASVPDEAHPDHDPVAALAPFTPRSVADLFESPGSS